VPSTITTRILRYLIAHPDAKDTASGIARWWLRGTKPRIDEIEAVLNVLVSQGWLKQRVNLVGETLYSVNKRYLSRIRLYLMEEARREKEKKENNGKS